MRTSQEVNWLLKYVTMKDSIQNFLVSHFSSMLVKKRQAERERERDSGNIYIEKKQ